MRFIMSLLLLVHVAADVSTVHVAADISTVHPSSFYWNMDGARTSSAGAGFSFYSHIFSLFSESVGGLPDQMQMGLGGTWLTPTNISWSTLAPGVCACDPNGWPSATKGDPAFGCCETDARCSFLYETFEGGPGYWIGMLPTAQPKWRVNSAVGCYRDQASTPLFNFGEAGKPHSCESMGIAQLSNRMLMAPDGLTFAAGAQGMGMVGVAYVRTPLGKTSDADVRNFWTILVDTADFAGPLGYFIPEFWAERWDSPNPSPASAAIGDLGKPGVGLSMGGGAFEWNTLYNFKHESSGSYKVPAMALPLGPDGRTTLFQDARGYESADVYEPLEAALAAGALNASRVLAGGSPMQCTNGSTAATYRLEGSDAAHLIPVGTLRTTVNSEGVARWAFEPDPKITPALDGKLPEYYSAALEPITAADAPADLVKARFPSKSDMGAYDGLSHPPSGGCASSPGPADEGHLHCVQTSSPSWIGYKWYKFVEQPAFLRAKLSGSEAAYLQGRVETLHRMLQGGGDEASRWIKQRGTPEALATVDGAQLVTPPPGFEVGYVPIALYEGVAKPHGASADGPWELTAPLLDVHHPEMSHADGTPVVFANPSALLLANGTAALMFRDYLQKLPFPSTNVIGLAWSHHGWQGPYEAADVQPQIFPDYAEDPHIYRDRRGHWHMLAHSLCDEWPECPAVGGHAASVDGRAWRYTSAAAYTTTVEFEDGESVTFSRRERPELLMDAQGHPSYLITGVVDKGGGGMEDRSWTLVQPIRGPAGARR